MVREIAAKKTENIISYFLVYILEMRTFGKKYEHLFTPEYIPFLPDITTTWVLTQPFQGMWLCTTGLLRYRYNICIKLYNVTDNLKMLPTPR